MRWAARGVWRVDRRRQFEITCWGQTRKHGSFFFYEIIFCRGSGPCSVSVAVGSLVRPIPPELPLRPTSIRLSHHEARVGMRGSAAEAPNHLFNDTLRKKKPIRRLEEAGTRTIVGWGGSATL